MNIIAIPMLFTSNNLSREKLMVQLQFLTLGFVHLKQDEFVSIPV